jgi:hypothetical protein
MPSDVETSAAQRYWVCVPPEYRDHPLLRERLFLALPRGLVDAVERLGLHRRFDESIWRLENAVAEQCCTNEIVGFWSLQPVTYPLLRPISLVVTAEVAAEIGWTRDQMAVANGLGAQRSDRFATICQAYAGWLLADRAFVAEHRQIFQDWQSEVATFGVPKMGPVVFDASRVPSAQQIADPHMQRFVEEFESFFVRWRLAGMAAPLLPEPLAPQLPVTLLQSVLGHMRHGGKTFYLPDTFPVPSRDELRDILEEALRGSEAPQHLRGWSEIVQATNVAKNAIPRYARLFRLQHYWRAIYERHGDRLRRSKAAVEEAMSVFFETSQDTIRHDLGLIASHLGEKWWSSAA